jgi:hypothetical protein
MDWWRASSQKLWWLSPTPGIVWSPVERWTRGTIWAIAFGLGILPLWGVSAIAVKLGLDRHVSAAISLFVCAPLALWLARAIALRVWPDKLREADQNAIKRIESQKRRDS